ncbi:hypothetical protein L0Z16_03465 [Burkholderia multivorans]|uniref:hypothetical protein n=1 Tax=Burkholderia multivorans TaxID=87883 RepID=UPI002018A117|nr:hypothetical protein [Burkholderia multivorans]MCL4664453.1 hypothetical protein [Burkholderia multivorans]MCO1355847.1 hypothetical protein [Burkholderia multivorans]MCO1415969.1 hypothetical protein [Burkholderia multivorans]MCO1449911.1 hypothetical protein [Burkholderia multivorans]UQP43337.1 hypothetical protein L0Z16_03465 [Burkholderia multivorans]
MTLTPEKREALTIARRRIATEADTYICYALSYVATNCPGLDRAAIELKCYIADQLGAPFTGLETWQRRNGFGGRSLAQQRRDRLAWIDWMLDEPKEE